MNLEPNLPAVNNHVKQHATQAQSKINLLHRQRLGYDEDSRQSISANSILLCGGALTWMSKKQVVVALSSTEAEYTALTAPSQETMYNRSFMQSIGYPQKEATVLRCDNQSALALAKNPIHHARTRHIDVKQHFIRQAVTNGHVKFEYVQIDKNIADLFTKSLPKECHVEHCSGLGLTSLLDIINNNKSH